MRRAISRRSHTLRLTCLLIGALLLLPAFLPGCGDDKKTNPPPSGYPAATSPSLCLANLKDAYEEQKGDEYARLFHDDFVFVFNPDDVSDPENPTPATWGVDSELQSARNLFADSTVERIDLSWNTGDSTAWTEVSPEGLKILADGVYLTVSTRNEQGEPLYLVVQGALHWFYFVPDPSSGGGNARLGNPRVGGLADRGEGGREHLGGDQEQLPVIGRPGCGSTGFIDRDRGRERLRGASWVPAGL